MFQKNLWNAWITISDLRDSVTKKRHRLQLLRQKLKLASILKEQVSYLFSHCLKWKAISFFYLTVPEVHHFLQI